MSAPARAFTMRHVQLLRALFAAVAALMITFSSDHSAAVGLAVFRGFALVTALVHILAAWLVLPSGSRWSAILLAVVSAIAGMAGGVPAWRTDDMFFIVLITWGEQLEAAASGERSPPTRSRSGRWACSSRSSCC